MSYTLNKYTYIVKEITLIHKCRWHVTTLNLDAARVIYTLHLDHSNYHIDHDCDNANSIEKNIVS